MENSKTSKKKDKNLDFAERMVKIEKAVSRSFGKNLNFKNTETYKDLSEKEKKELEKRLNKKDKGKTLLGLTLFIPLFGFLIINSNMTGNVVKNTIGSQGASLGNVFLISFLVITLGIFISLKIKDSKETKKIENHRKVLDGVIGKERFKKRK